MQPVEYTRFKKYIEATCRPDVWARRMRLAPELIERRHDSINSLVASVDGNSRDKSWLSSALSAGEVERDEIGRLCFPPPSAELPDDEAERGTLMWLLDLVCACDVHVSVRYMRQAVARAWRTAEEMRALGKVWACDRWEDKDS